MPTDSNETSISSSITTTATMMNNGPTTNSTAQLHKLKRFLSTLYYFGSDISSEIGERVRALILALVNNALSIEEFHGKVQSATNFPLRPFALPFLKSTLPHLQKDLSQLAHQSKQSTSQFIAQHEELILLPRDILERSTSPINENGKRKASEDSHEIDERPYATKRSTINHHHHRSFVSSSNNNNIRRDKDRGFSAYIRECGSEKNLEDDWKNVENMLNYILEMVTKAKRVLFVLQQKDNHFRHVMETNDLEWRRRQSNLLTQTEDRIVEIRRKAEETVLEIKRQSIIDLQKAVSQTEQKSNEILVREREQYQRLKAQTFEETYALLNRQEDGPEQCWHCARKAIETCSGCNIARYCGQYCQHRDWEFHQKICGPDLQRKLIDNPQLNRYSLAKFNPPNESSPIHHSDTASTTPCLSVSSPITTSGTQATANNEDNDEMSTVKTENI